VLILAAVLAIIAGIQLYILTDYTEHFFAWTIAQPLSATFLGTGYWTGAALLLFAAREKAWANIRVALAAVGAFVHASAQEEPLEGSWRIDRGATPSSSRSRYRFLQLHSWSMPAGDHYRRSRPARPCSVGQDS
jgi:hypothetical protein